jgi:type II secretory pathway predicted ATPase ExeA/pSer/pThr/pTyr-binding forkhead associated (FHA) protein
MQENHSALGNKAFGDASDALTTVKYRSHIDAVKAVESSLCDAGAISLLFGSDGAGKSTILRQFSMHLSAETDVILLDGRDLEPQQFLSKMLQQLGSQPSSVSVEQMLREVRAIVVEQSQSWQAPVLIVDNVERMHPSGLGVLNTLAGIEVDSRFALRLILAGTRSLQNLVDSEGLSNISQRYPGSFTMEPLSAKETMIYLHARLQAAGSERADTIFPFDVCDRLRKQSGGWPGMLNLFALEAIKRCSGFPLSVVDTYGAKEKTREASATNIPVLELEERVSRKPPRLVVSRDGKTISEFVFNGNKVLLGRSDFVDVVVDDDFVSKVHAVFLLYTDALVLLDLNSSNGTTVNSVPTRKTILKSHDIITLGSHRLKVENAPEVSDDMEELLKSPDTLKMKNLIDLRRQRAKRRMKSAI